MTNSFVVKPDNSKEDVVVGKKDKNYVQKKIDFRVKRIGLKIGGDVVQEIDIPIDSIGVIEQTANLRDDGITPVYHLIGYVDKNGNIQVQVFDYLTGEKVEVDMEKIPINSPVLLND